MKVNQKDPRSIKGSSSFNEMIKILKSIMHQFSFKRILFLRWLHLKMLKAKLAYFDSSLLWFRNLRDMKRTLHFPPFLLDVPQVYRRKHLQAKRMLWVSCKQNLIPWSAKTTFDIVCYHVSLSPLCCSGNIVDCSTSLVQLKAAQTKRKLLLEARWQKVLRRRRNFKIVLL